jgi:hypothetical protein
MKLVAFFLLSALVAGCDPIAVTAITVPPPGKVAQLDDENLELKISHGIALGFECTATTNEYNGPCRNPRAKIADESIAAVFSSYLDSVAETWDNGNAGPRSRTAFIVVGLAPGDTELEVITTDGDVDVSVTVVP